MLVTTSDQVRSADEGSLSRLLMSATVLQQHQWTLIKEEKTTGRLLDRRRFLTHSGTWQTRL